MAPKLLELLCKSKAAVEDIFVRGQLDVIVVHFKSSIFPTGSFTVTVVSEFLINCPALSSEQVVKIISSIPKEYMGETVTAAIIKLKELCKTVESASKNMAAIQSYFMFSEKVEFKKFIQENPSAKAYFP